MERRVRDDSPNGLLLVARLEGQSDVAQRLLNLDQIGLERNGKFLQRLQQFGVLRSLVVYGCSAPLDPFASGFVRHKSCYFFPTKVEVMLGKCSEKSITG